MAELLPDMHSAMMRYLLLLCTMLFVFGSVEVTPVIGADGDGDFEAQIRPLLKQHCVSCHGPRKQASGLRLDAKSFAMQGGDSGPVIVARDSQASSLYQRITSSDADQRMPPKGERLKASDQELIQRWIDAGATWIETDEDHAVARDPRADHWAWQPLRDVTLPSRPTPTITSTTLSTGDAVDDIKNLSAIDLFLQAKLDEHGLQFSPQADRRTLIRRLSFDLLGLPPTPAQIDEFEADNDPQAYEHLVDRLLNSPHYGERAAQHWLDIAHYADTHGFERDQVREHAWRYRDWVIAAFNSDMPYDEFVRKQIAGDALDTNDPQSVTATGFLAAGPWDFVGQAETPSPVLKRLARADDLDDMVTQVMAATMAMTVNCARCHDHKLDPILQREYYQLCSIFAGAKRGNRPTSSIAEEKRSVKQAALTEASNNTKQELRALMTSGWDLADVVGGGNGLGTGKPGAGIDPGSGKSMQELRGFLDGATANNYALSPLSIVDGVTIPGDNVSDGLVISSTGLRATDLPATSGKAWDAIRNGPVNSQFSTKLSGTDVNDGAHKLLALHANALITFDLKELPTLTTTGATHAHTLRGSVGYFGQTPRAGASVFVLVDGQQVFKRERLGRDDGLQAIEVQLPDDARFLTLIATDGDNGISHDQVCFADLTLNPAASTTSDDSKRAEAERLDKADQLKSKLESLTKQLTAIGQVEQVYGVLSEAPPKTRLLARGDTEQPSEEVQPGALACVSGLDSFTLPETASDFERRQRLAEWITADKNPLLARVIVNRVWQQHFGVGLVATPSDFGLGGSLPSHPELLDWLAVQLKQQRYSLKAMHRLICNSLAYRQQSLLRPTTAEHQHGLAIDSSNRYLWRQNPRRLDAESLRDAVLSVSGQLDFGMYGPGFREFDYKEEYAPVYTYVTKADRDALRRSVYRFRVRTTPNPLLTVLDCPNPANLTPTRNTTTTALQALALLNHEFLLQQSDRLAERLKQLSEEPAQQVIIAWQLALGREPHANERSAAQALIDKHGLATFCRYLLNANEFVSID